MPTFSPMAFFSFSVTSACVLPRTFLMLLKEAAHDQYDYISWWLYEGTPDYRVWTDDERKEWYLKEPGALYDFIRDECK